MQETPPCAADGSLMLPAGLFKLLQQTTIKPIVEGVAGGALHESVHQMFTEHLLCTRLRRGHTEILAQMPNGPRPRGRLEASSWWAGGGGDGREGEGEKNQLPPTPDPALQFNSLLFPGQPQALGGPLGIS